jgi:hypothetical protein
VFYFFDNAGARGRLYANVAAVASPPLAIGAWIRPDSLTTQMVVAGLFNSGSTPPIMRINTTPAGKIETVLRTDGSVSSVATSVTGLSNSAPQFVLGGIDADGSTVIYLGENEEDTGAAPPAGWTVTVNTTSIAHRLTTSIDNYYTGDIGPVFIFDFLPGGDMRRALARGYTPDHFPKGLKLYQKLIRLENDPGIGPAMTKTGGINVVDHPRNLIYPRRRSIVVPASITSVVLSKATLSLTGKPLLAAMQAPLAKAGLALTGKTAFAAVTVPANKNTLALSGKPVLAAVTPPVAAAPLALTGKALQGAAQANLGKATLTLTGKDIAVAGGNTVALAKAALVLSGKTLLAALQSTIAPAGLVLTGKTFIAAAQGQLDKRTLSLTGKTLFAARSAVIGAAALALAGKALIAPAGAVLGKATLTLLGKAIAIGAPTISMVLAALRLRPSIGGAVDLRPSVGGQPRVNKDT